MLLDVGSTPTISTNWNACGMLYLGFWTHTASGKKASYGYVYRDVAIVFLQYLTPGVLASFKECGIQSNHNQVKTIQSAVLKGWWIL